MFASIRNQPDSINVRALDRRQLNVRFFMLYKLFFPLMLQQSYIIFVCYVNWTFSISSWNHLRFISDEFSMKLLKKSFPIKKKAFTSSLPVSIIVVSIVHDCLLRQQNISVDYEKKIETDCCRENQSIMQGECYISLKAIVTLCKSKLSNWLIDCYTYIGCLWCD